MAREPRDDERNWKPLAVGIIVGTVLLGLIVFGALRMMDNSSTPPPPREQKITVIPQPPPPPPPPPKEEPPPPPEQPKVEQPTPEDKPQEEADSSDEPPAGNDLGVDGDGTGSGDGFGLVGKKGGRGLVGGGDRNRWYAGMVQQELQRLLAENERVRSARYSAVVKLWLKPEGSVERFDLSGNLGDARSEAAVRAVLAGMKLAEAPPEDMPQPLRLRIVSR